MDDLSETLESLPLESTTPEMEGTDSTQEVETIPETSEETSVETTDNETVPEYVFEPVYDFYESETTAATEEIVLVDVIESVGSDIAHANLFSGFLVCGTLVGIALLRKIYGT